MNDLRLLNGVFDKVSDVNNQLMQIWIKYIVFSWRWWFAVALTIIPWIVWFKIKDKENTARLLFVGLVVIITTDSLDIIGLSFHLWHYDWTLLPFIPEFIPWDYTLFPIAIMLLLQFYPKTSAIFKAIIFATSSAFIMEPLFFWLDMYDMVHWKFWYSFIIYIPMYLLFNTLYKSKLFSNN